MTVLGVEQDRVIFQGSGVNGQPRGISNKPGINTITFGGAAAYRKFINAAKLADTSNPVIDNPTFVLTPAAKGKGLTNARYGGTSAAIISDDSKIGDFPAMYTNQLPNDRMYRGSNWGDVVVGEWAHLDVVVDYVTMFRANRVKVTVDIFCDLNLRYPSSFTVSTDSAAQ